MIGTRSLDSSGIRYPNLERWQVDLREQYGEGERGVPGVAPAIEFGGPLTGPACSRG